jgi:TPP-dependent pyruvate/acetoin dehydrogenase alpha subunit
MARTSKSQVQITKKSRTAQKKQNRLPDHLLLKMYTDMVRIRQFEETALYHSTQGHVHGALHLYVGEEAIAVGVCSALDDDDYVASTHRGHGHCLAKGGKPDRMMAELFGRIDGYCKGKGGSMHLADFGRRMLGANGIVAAGLGMAAGAALGAKVEGMKYVSVAFFGDGGATRGPFHEVLNLSSLWKLPVVFVCENNGYAQWMSHEQNLVVEDISTMANSYAMAGVTIDGNDVLEVYHTAVEAVERARAGDGPTLIECKTYRIYGHSLGDMNVYRTKAEIDAWKAETKDPISRFQRYLTDLGLLSGQMQQRIAKETESEMEAAVQFGLESPYPGPDQLLADVTTSPP